MTTQPPLPIAQRIESGYDELSPQEQRAADVILDHQSDLAVFNAAELARLSGVSKATVSRLFRRLGFDSFQEARDEARLLRSLGVPVVVDVPDGEAAEHRGGSRGSTASASAGGFEAHREREFDNLRKALSGLEGGRLHQIVSLIGDASSVLILGMRNSFPLALHLRQQLIQSRAHVRVAPQPGQSVGEEIAGLGPGDLVILVGFRRRPEGFGRLLEAVRETGASTVMIADGSARRHVDSVDVFVECPIDAVGAFDSYASGMSVISVIASGVLSLHIREGRARISDINDLYDELGEIEV